LYLASYMFTNNVWKNLIETIKAHVARPFLSLCRPGDLNMVVAWEWKSGILLPYKVNPILELSYPDLHYIWIYFTYHTIFSTKVHFKRPQQATFQYSHTFYVQRFLVCDTMRHIIIPTKGFHFPWSLQIVTLMIQVLPLKKTCHITNINSSVIILFLIGKVMAGFSRLTQTRPEYRTCKSDGTYTYEKF